MSPNTNLLISSPFDASKAQQDSVTVETPGESTIPLIQVSLREVSAGGTSMPVSFPLTFSIPSRPKERGPKDGPVPNSTKSVDDAHIAQSRYREIRPRSQYHPYSRPPQTRVNGGAVSSSAAGRPRHLRRATTEPAGFDQDDIVTNATSSSSKPARNSSSVSGNALPATATVAGSNRPSPLRRALTAQPGTFASTFAPDGPGTVDKVSSFGTTDSPSASMPLRYQPTMLSGSGSSGRTGFPASETASSPAQSPHIVNSRPVTLVGPASHGFIGQPPPYRSYRSQSQGAGLAYPQRVPVQTSLGFTGVPFRAAYNNGASFDSMPASANQRQAAIERSTAVAEKSNLDECTRPLELIFIPRSLPEAVQSKLARAYGPKEALYFNQTKTGLGTLLSDCINHAHNSDFMYGLGDEELPLSWTRHLMDSPEPDYLYIELTWPGYPRLLHRVKCQIRDRVDVPTGQTIAKRLLAREIAQGFYTMYQKIQRNENKLQEGKQINERYLPQDGRWELGPKWIPVDNIKLVTLQWAYGYTFQAQMAVSII